MWSLGNVLSLLVAVVLMHLHHAIVRHVERQDLDEGVLAALVGHLLTAIFRELAVVGLPCFQTSSEIANLSRRLRIPSLVTKLRALRRRIAVDGLHYPPPCLGPVQHLDIPEHLGHVALQVVV